jgi:glycosyltransferase involved in cell wall biosynthesis
MNSGCCEPEATSRRAGSLAREHFTAQSRAGAVAATAVVNASLMEGFGMPVLEAMACGTVVVVSDRGAHPEVVDDAGLLVPPTAEGIVAGLRDVLTSPDRATDLSRRAVEAVEQSKKFRWKYAATVWANALQYAVEKGAK